MPLWTRQPRTPDPVVEQILDIPECAPGAPMPIVFAEQGAAGVAYYASPRWQSAHRPGWRQAAVGVLFPRVSAVYFGRPGDESFGGHPLFKYGLNYYTAARVRNSPWIESLMAMHSLHPAPRPEAYADLLHFILPFQDSTFECVGREYSVVLADAESDTPAAILRSLFERSPLAPEGKRSHIDEGDLYRG
jgi:hypothetical protein